MIKYKVAGRPVKLNKGEKSDGTDWTVTFKNGKTTSLANVLALIEPKPELTMKENIDINRFELKELINLIKTADNPRNLSIYYNSGHNAVNIGGVGYDKGELVQKFNSKPGQSLNIKTLFWKANKSAEEIVDKINNMNAGVKAELKYGYGNEPFVIYKKANTLAEIKKLGLDDTITTDMWDQGKIEAAGDKINYPNWFKKDHKIINYNSRVGRISFDHPAHPKRSDEWVNRFLKDEYRVDLSDQPRGMLQVREEKERKLTYDDFVSMVRADMNAGSASDEYVSDERVKRDAKWKYSEYLQGASLDDLFLYEATKEEEDEFHKKLDKLIHDTFGKREGELEEAKATCCHRCGRVHVKGTPCKRPYLKGKDSCAVKEVQDLQERLDSLKETKSAPEGHYFTKSGNLVKGRMTKAAEERGARKSDPKDKMRSKIPKVTQYTEIVKEYIKSNPKMKKSEMMEAVKNIIKTNN